MSRCNRKSRRAIAGLRPNMSDAERKSIGAAAFAKTAEAKKRNRRKVKEESKRAKVRAEMERVAKKREKKTPTKEKK